MITLCIDSQGKEGSSVYERYSIISNGMIL